jgi:rubrerythrin
VKNALALEYQSIATYKKLQPNAEKDWCCTDALEETLCHLLAEEEMHRKILLDAAAAKLTLSVAEALLLEPPYCEVADTKPLGPDALAQWGKGLTEALEQEEKTWIYYSNLRRISKVAVVRKAFEALALREKDHMDVLGRLLGRSANKQSTTAIRLP